MKVTTKSCNYDYRDFYKIIIERDNTKPITLEFSDGEPEDACLARDFCDVYDIPKLMEMAYQAGKANEEFNTEHVEIETLDDWD